MERPDAGERVENDPRDGLPGRRRERRIIVNGREVNPSLFQGHPGTVVITKDKKGRLTDLVVNGQHVETAIGKGKRGKGQQVEVVQFAPFGGADVRSFAFRTDGELDPQVRSEVENNVQRDIERDLQRNRNFQFDFSDSGDQFDKSFRMAPNGSLNRVYRLNGLSNGGSDPESRRATLEALRGAERGLRTAAAAKGLNTEQRKEISKELEKVRTQLKKAESAPATGPRLNGRLDLSPDMREHEQEMREHQRDMREHQRDMQEHQRELQQEQRDTEQDQADRDRADPARDQTERARERADRARDRAEHSRERNEALVEQLQKDGLILDKDNFQLRLTPNSLTVNGKEQPAKVRDKYLKLYDQASGRPLTGTGSMIISRNSNTNVSQSEGPPPPRPPRAPMGVPPAPPMGALPAPPAPPRPPRVDAAALRSELRKDGVLAADEKNLQFQLNASGLTVNGKKQPDELAAKYRKMTGHTDGKNFNVMISTQED